MNHGDLAYLRVLHRLALGPLRELATDSATAYRFKAIAGVLARLTAHLASESFAVERLRTVAQEQFEPLRALAGDDPQARLDLQHLQTLLTHPDLSFSKLEAAIGVLLKRFVKDGGLSADFLKPFVEADSAIWKQIESDLSTRSSETLATSDEAVGCMLSGRETELAQWLREQPGEMPGLGVDELKLVPGGFSKQTVFASLRNVRALPEQIVLRIDRPESPLETSVVVEYPLLKVLHEAGIRVPRPLAIESGSIVGAPMLAVERLQGEVIADGQHFFSSNLPFSYARSLAAQMAAYHAIPIEKLPRELNGHGQSNRALMEAELQRFRNIWDETGHVSITVEAAFQWLLSNLDWAGDARGLVHGDMRFHNVLVHAGEVSALLDWEIASIGNPALDLGYVYQHIVQLGDWQAFLDAYAAAGGQLPSPRTMDFYILRTELFVSVFLARMAAGFQSGVTDKIELGYAGIELGRHALYLLSQRLERCLALDE